MITVTCPTPDDTRACARKLAAMLKPLDVIVLAGGLGAGKTLFTAGLAAGLGIDEPVVSPSFVLVRQYDSGFLPLDHGLHCGQGRLGFGIREFEVRAKLCSTRLVSLELLFQIVRIADGHEDHRYHAADYPDACPHPLWAPQHVGPSRSQDAEFRGIQHWPLMVPRPLRKFRLRRSRCSRRSSTGVDRGVSTGCACRQGH